MKFLHPGALWLLLGIPVLILIYIIKSNHEEHSVSSTYIWKLSQKFMKRRVPLQRLRKIISFILQLLIIITSALLAAQPLIAAEGSGTEYVIILDSSASMQTTDENGKTRFEKAKEEINKIINEAGTNTPVTIISAGPKASYEQVRNSTKNSLLLSLDELECTLGTADIEGAISLAQLICDDYAVSDCILYTDKQYEKADNIEVVDLSSDEWNVSITGLKYKYRSGLHTFTFSAVSHGKEASVVFALDVDGATADAISADLPMDEEVSISFALDELPGGHYETAEDGTRYYVVPSEFEIAEVFTTAEDSFAEDNSYSLCQRIYSESKVLIVSGTPYYLEALFDSMQDLETTVVSSLSEATLSGYDLYVFDGQVPSEYPEDGSVWIFNPDTAPLDMTLSEAVDTEYMIKKNSTSKSDAVASVMKDVDISDAYVATYKKLSAGNSWVQVLKARTNGVLFVREEENNLRTAVFAFDLHDTNLPMLADYVTMMRNLIDYSIPSIVAKTDYTVCEDIPTTLLPFAESFSIIDPEGEEDIMRVSTYNSVYNPDKVGIYTAVQVLSSGSVSEARFFVHVSEEEMTNEDGGKISIVPFDASAQSADTIVESNYKNIWLYLAIALLIFILLEWGVYHYEQL